MRRTRELAVAGSLLIASLALAVTMPASVPAAAVPVDQPTTGMSASTQWNTAFSTKRHPLVESMDFAGHPLDVAFDNQGAVWTIGEFGMQIIRAKGTEPLGRFTAVKTYHNGPELIGWTRPFNNGLRMYDPNLEPRASTSSLGESIIHTGGEIWALYGGNQPHPVDSPYVPGNHSLLVRVATTAPYAMCVVPLPGDNNQAIGLAYDSARDRVWFTESEADGLQAGDYSRIGWVKASGLGSQCLNELDYGGHPGYSEAVNASKRATAQAVINDLRCTSGEGAAADCVHLVGKTLPTGAAHVVYDAGLDALWISNWASGELVKYSIAGNTFVTYDAPSSPMAWPNGPVWWQIAVRGDAVFVNEYEGNRLLRFDKSSKRWSAISTPTVGPSSKVETHSITRAGNKLWFTASNEHQNPTGTTLLGYVDLDAWAQGSAVTSVYPLSGSDLAYQPVRNGKLHSLRGLDVAADGRIAVTNHGDLETLVLTPK